MNNDDFDELPALRRAYANLEQRNGDLGEKIGVLKQERARLWYALQSLLNEADDPESGAGEEKTEAILADCREAIEQVRIDK